MSIYTILKKTTEVATEKSGEYLENFHRYRRMSQRHHHYQLLEKILQVRYPITLTRLLVKKQKIIISRSLGF
jgi:hypothetical protein